jgi:hypothetical protein
MIQLSVPARNARLDAIEAAVGPSGRLRIYTGAQPADCAAAATGTLLVDTTLPSDWMAAASGGVKALLGSWSSAAVGTGTVGHYRIWDSAVANCHVQGSVTATGGGGDMTVDAVSGAIATGQTVNVTSYSLTDANA